MITRTAAADVRTADRDAARRTERVFYSGMSLAMLLVVVAGFSRTYYLRTYFGGGPLSGVLHLHGIVFSAWLVLLIVQTALVAARRTAVHRRLGWGGAALALMMLVLGTYTALERAFSFTLPPEVAPTPLVFLTIPLGDMVMFGTFAGLAMYLRRRIDVHKRLMLLATIAILPAATSRLPNVFFPELGAWAPLVFFALADLFIVPMLLFDWKTRGSLHRTTVIGGLALVASHPLRLMIGFTAPWLAFAEWATRWTR